MVTSPRDAIGFVRRISGHLVPDRPGILFWRPSRKFRNGNAPTSCTKTTQQKLTLTGAYREGTERARAPFSHTEKKGTSRASLSHPHLLFCLSPALPSSTCAGGVTFYFGMSFDISAMCLDTASTSLRHAPMFPASCRISARERIRGCAQVHSTVPFRPSIFP